ncbi:MAG: YbaK/EbsC family protein [Thermomicrobiales bacterium]|jgi:Cys-tRNA(Pro)/Cys-tRNA(Cys) deacylase|nr:YbaK/EbsC family protein [Thermomicrobiales bacterium]
MAEDATADPAVLRFEAFARANGITYDLVDTGTHTLTVSQAADAVGVDEEHVIKTLLFHDGEGGCVIAIANGANRVDAALLAQEAGFDPLKLAKPHVVIERLGYPAGGVPPIGLPPDIPVIVDARAATLEWCVGGAGSITHLARLAMADIVRVNSATIASVTQVEPPG